MVINIDKSLFDSREHEVYKALAVKQPYADELTQATWRDAEGVYYAKKDILIRTRKVNYRGDVLICSSASPEVEGHLSGATCGLVELYDVRPASELTEEQWDAVAGPASGKFAYFFRNPRRVIEMPVRGEMGLFTLYAAKGDVMCYPREVVIGAETWKKMRKKMGK